MWTVTLVSLVAFTGVISLITFSLLSVINYFLAVLVQRAFCSFAAWLREIDLTEIHLCP